MRFVISKQNTRLPVFADFCERQGKPDYYISRLMKRYFPYTFTQYLQKRRLLQAAYLLTETKDPIESIILDDRI